MLYCVNLFYEMNVEAVTLCCCVKLVSTQSCYRQDKQTLLEDSLMYSRMNTIKWNYGLFSVFFIINKLDVAVRIYQQRSGLARAGEVVSNWWTHARFYRRLAQPRSQSSSVISDVTSPVKPVEKICARFQASSGYSDSANRPGYEAAASRLGKLHSYIMCRFVFHLFPICRKTSLHMVCSDWKQVLQEMKWSTSIVKSVFLLQIWGMIATWPENFIDS